MLKLAITGGIACGKSLASASLVDGGLAVCDVDGIVHEVQRSGGAVHARIVEAFGIGVLQPDGELDRARLGALVFQDAAARARLERLVHPEVRARWLAWLDAREREGAARAAVAIPLLYEGGLDVGWDAVLCVGAPVELQVDRLLGRGLDREGAWARIRAQLPVEEKMKRADLVVYNAGSRAWLREQVFRVLRHLVER